MIECERCEDEVQDEYVETITLDEEYNLCRSCIGELGEDVEYYDWRDRYTEEQHERAVKLMTERDEFQCVLEDYEKAQILVHTPYVASNVITDFCNHFNYRIVSFHPIWEEEDTWPCVDTHGSTFQIAVEYSPNSEHPIPTNVAFQETHIDELDEHDKQF